MPRRVRPAGEYVPDAPYSPGIVHDDLVWIAGQDPADQSGTIVEGGIGPQTRRTLDDVAAVLEAAESSPDRLVSVTAFPADPGDYGGFDAAYADRVPEPYPARTTVAPGGLAVSSLVETEAVAPRGGGRSDG